MTEAYMEWSISRGDEGLGNLDVENLAGEVTDGHDIMVIDLFSEHDSVFYLVPACWLYARDKKNCFTST